MKFGKTLSSSVYGPWRENYIDYSKLKHLLREEKAVKAESTSTWTEDDETQFAEELLNVQLDKVNNFQSEKYLDIKSRTSQCEGKLQSLNISQPTSGDGGNNGSQTTKDDEDAMREILPELDSISNEINHLERFSRINFTGFRKIVKKHDKRRGSTYKLRAILAARLADLPLNTEDYSPLLYRLSAMYSFIRHHIQDEKVESLQALEAPAGDEEYESSTFFVHPDDLVEVKTTILRHLPVLVYNPSPKAPLEGPQNDPELTSIYFDSPNFALYQQRLERKAGASSLRLRWFGDLDDASEVTLERKTLAGLASSRDQRIQLKKKYILPFINGEYDMEKKINKLRERGADSEEEAARLSQKVHDIQDFIAQDELKPLVRASYKRTAFQIPGDDSVRVSIDTDLRFVRESLPEGTGSPFPRSEVRTVDTSDFPWAILTIKLHGERSNRTASWVNDLTTSHLLREAPKFSKFVHGVASLFEDNVVELPFWMALLDTDIRRDPQVAFEEEKTREEQRAEEALAVGSYGGTPRRKSSFHPQSMQPKRTGSQRHDLSKMSYSVSPAIDVGKDGAGDSRNGVAGAGSELRLGLHWYSGIRKLVPGQSKSKYALSRRRTSVLPPGVEEPKVWIKDSGPVKVEPKVWLANQRTFIKWQHVSVLLASLSLGLYNSAGRHNETARALGVAYTIIAIAIAIWGWIMYTFRSQVIRARSGTNLDHVLGPIVVCVSLGIALCVNLGLRLGE